MKDFTPTPRTRIKRLPKRARYDRDTVYSILDAGFVCHLGYVIDKHPFVTPTAYWREGDAVYWHGSSKSRMLLALEKNPNVCLTVTHFDGLVVARSGFHMSVNYRSAMIFGKPYKVSDPEEKLAKMEKFVERLYPGHWNNLRPVHKQELKAMSVFGLHLEEAVAKVRTGGPIDEPEDYRLPIWAGVVPVQQVLGAPQDDGRLAPGTSAAPKVTL
ncbi:MAG: pyridoxamine 5'-phosphate oxidase family protein [Betaproteobacteria bacterium]|nr:pyridoxamine 5'-phosphate oxidase family protein [Betaproteobacteria bacterium]MDH5221943.1 pyridoxamine 5'-phosphate oxidase family protein [Betaproteobacteria bacterium]MDH5349506.1 pyridoxamine 5'-phosphate oxidase family protein [Betaproteobacteria bacterium]